MAQAVNIKCLQINFYFYQLSGAIEILAVDKMNHIKRLQRHTLWSGNLKMQIPECLNVPTLRIAKALVYYLLRINHVSCLSSPGESQQHLCLLFPNGLNPARLGPAFQIY